MKIQSLIREKGLHQADFEPLAGLPKGRISKWAGGQGEPTARQALRMARLLGVPIEYLSDDEMEEIPDRPITDRERRIWEVVRTIGLDEAWRRLVGAGNGAGADRVPAEAAVDQAGEELSRARRGAGGKAKGRAG